MKSYRKKLKERRAESRAKKLRRSMKRTKGVRDIIATMGETSDTPIDDLNSYYDVVSEIISSIGEAEQEILSEAPDFLIADDDFFEMVRRWKKAKSELNELGLSILEFIGEIKNTKK